MRPPPRAWGNLVLGWGGGCPGGWTRPVGHGPRMPLSAAAGPSGGLKEHMVRVQQAAGQIGHKAAQDREGTRPKQLMEVSSPSPAGSRRVQAGSTPAHQHNSTPAHQHNSTPAHQHTSRQQRAGKKLASRFKQTADQQGQQTSKGSLSDRIESESPMRNATRPPATRCLPAC